MNPKWCLSSLVLVMVAAFILGDTRPAEGCGMYHPSSISERFALGVPDTTFILELDKYVAETGYRPRHAFNPPLPCAHPWSTNASVVQTSRTDSDELHIALFEMGIPEEERVEIVTRYREVREVLQDYAQTMHRLSNRPYQPENFETFWRQRVNKLRADGWAYQESRLSDSVHYFPIDALEVPDGLPPEFDLYIRGAIQYYMGEWCLARENWENLLELPPDQRRYRSTWAAYMIGRTSLGEDSVYAAYWLDQTRMLAESGFTDNLGLAAETYSLEAKAHVDYGNYTMAIERYFDVFASGDCTSYAKLGESVQRLIDIDPTALREAALNPIVREVVTIWLSSGVYIYQYGYLSERQSRAVELWIDTLEEAGIEDQLMQADHLAWAAYLVGDFDLADRWLGYSADSGLAYWLRARLAIRDGRLEDALDFLELASVEFPEREYWPLSSHIVRRRSRSEPVYTEDVDWTVIWPFPYRRIMAERGLILLALERYTESLDSFVRSSYLYNIAYVAEKALTPDELKTYVDRTWPDPGPDVNLPGRWYTLEYFALEGDAQKACVIRYFLAQRLARLGRWREALEYYPVNLKPTFETYVQGIRRGHDTSLPLSERADAFWEAAVIARHDGITLLGAQLNPDFAIIAGGGFMEEISGLRTDPEIYQHFPSSEAEIERVQQSLLEVVPFERFHYRYVACDHAWSSVELMPDEDDETARRLCIAGGWLKNRDPIAADVFYKAMVNRCRSTWLGQEADRIRWFPDCNSVPPF